MRKMSDVIFQCSVFAFGAVALLGCNENLGGFKARRYTLAEICAWQKTNKKASSCERKVIDNTKIEANEQVPPAPEVPEGQGRGANGPAVEQTTVIPKGSESVFTSPSELDAKSAARLENEGAKGKVLEESREVEGEQKNIRTSPSAMRDSLVATTDKLLAEAPDHEVSKLIHGVDIEATADRAQQAVFVNIVAMADLEGKLQKIQMNQPMPIKYDADGRVTALSYELQEKIDGPIKPKSDALLIAATCATQDCSDIRVLMEFTVDGGKLWAAFKLVYEPGSEGVYKTEKTNLVHLKTVAQVLQDMSLTKPEEDKQPSGAVKPEDDKQPSGAVKPEDDKQPSGAVKPEDDKQPSGAVKSGDDKQPSGAVKPEDESLNDGWGYL